MFVREEAPGAGHRCEPPPPAPSISGRQSPRAVKHPPAHSPRHHSLVQSCYSPNAMYFRSVSRTRKVYPAMPENICHAYHTSCSAAAPWTVLALLSIDAGDFLLSTKTGKHHAPQCCQVLEWQCFFNICQTIAFFFFPNCEGAELIFWHKCLGSKACSFYSFYSFLLSYFAKWPTELKGAFS